MRNALITGGTGSFGKAFITQILTDKNVKRVVVFSRDELKQHDMQQEFKDERLRWFLGDIRDKERLVKAMRGIDTVIHAAALKQVPASEYNPDEFIKTNVLGSMNVRDAAIEAKVKKVIALSTDKAVSPANLYGATKLAAEGIFINGNAYSTAKDTKFSVVRYGNVVGSRGSVIPLFMEQKKTGVLTITDERMTRFWITLPQAVKFVIDAISDMHGGEIFVPEIPSVGIVQLAKAICLDCKIEVIGIRPGEKLHETLISDMEAEHAIYQYTKNRFIVYPTHNWFDRGRISGGPLNAPYTSDTNNWVLYSGAIIEMLGAAHVTV